MRYAIIRDGKVENLVEWDGTDRWAPPAGTVAVPADDHSEIGGTYDGRKFRRRAEHENGLMAALTELTTTISNMAVPVSSQSRWPFVLFGAVAAALGIVQYSWARKVEVPAIGSWPGVVTVCPSEEVDKEVLDRALALWRKRGHPVEIGDTDCEVTVMVDPRLDDDGDIDGFILHGRTEVDHYSGHLVMATVTVLPNSNELVFAHEIGHALGYLHATSVSSGHLMHPSSPSLRDWRGLDK